MLTYSGCFFSYLRPYFIGTKSINIGSACFRDFYVRDACVGGVCIVDVCIGG